jgi:hypothetical protein
VNKVSSDPSVNKKVFWGPDAPLKMIIKSGEAKIFYFVPDAPFKPMTRLLISLNNELRQIINER